MATENNCTAKLLLPIPPAALHLVYAWLKEHEFAEEWDDKFHLTGEQLIDGEGPLKLHARNVAFDEPAKLLALAKKFGFSALVHTEWTSVGECDVTSEIAFYDAHDNRMGSTHATNDTRVPLVTLREALRCKRSTLIKKYSLPKGLT